MSPSPLTPEQRSKAIRTRKKRSDAKKRLSHGIASLTEIFEEGRVDGAIGRMGLLDLLASLPAVDKAQATEIMEGIGIAATRRIGSLSSTEQEAVKRAFGDLRSPVQAHRPPQQPTESSAIAPGILDDSEAKGKLDHRPDTEDHVEVPAGTKASAASGERASKARPWLEKWGGKLGAAVAAVIIAALGALLGVWLIFFAGPPTPTPGASHIGDPGHPPGRQDVSTISPGNRFYAVANFFYFSACERPCWLPLYQEPTENSTGVTHGWPCEYYKSDLVATHFCRKPPIGRKPSEMANAVNKYSGDRLLVICQTTHISNRQAAQPIHNEAGQNSKIWDLVAVPARYISLNGVIGSRLHQVPGMKGFYEAYGSDVWLGNTGWHHIPCK